MTDFLAETLPEGFSFATAGVPRRIQAAITDDIASVHTWLGESLNLDTAIALAMWTAATKTFDAHLPYPAISRETLVGVACSIAGMEAEGVSAEAKAFVGMYLDAKKYALSYFIDLTGCHQVRALAERNIAGYFMSMGNTEIAGSKVLKVISALSDALPCFTSSKVYREHVKANVFLGYHTNASSTPALVIRFFGEEKDLAVAMIPARERKVVREAALAPHDLKLSKRISPRTIVIAGVYLQSVSACPSGWKQFESAKSAVSASFVAALQVLFASLSKIREKEVDFAGASDYNQLVERLPVNMTADDLDEDQDAMASQAGGQTEDLVEESGDASE